MISLSPRLKQELQETHCHCPGPGKFQGEPASTFIAWDLVCRGFVDEEIDQYSFIRYPHAPTHEEYHDAREAGYCGLCIEEAFESSQFNYGVMVYEDDTGFIYGTILATRKEWDLLQNELFRMVEYRKEES